MFRYRPKYQKDPSPRLLGPWPWPNPYATSQQGLRGTSQGVYRLTPSRLHKVWVKTSGKTHRHQMRFLRCVGTYLAQEWLHFNSEWGYYPCGFVPCPEYSWPADWWDKLNWCGQLEIFHRRESSHLKIIDSLYFLSHLLTHTQEASHDIPSSLTTIGTCYACIGRLI